MVVGETLETEGIAMRCGRTTQESVTFQEHLLTTLTPSELFLYRRPKSSPPQPRSQLTPAKHNTMDYDEQSQEVVETCEKQVKRGFRSFAEPQVCGISFERLPAWLWILRLVEWSDVWLSAPDDARIRQSYPTLYHRFGSRWKIAMPTIHEAVNRSLCVVG